jgi:hypothetical protein
MAREFEIDLTRFVDALDDAAETMAAGAKRGMHDALDDWRVKAIDIAPLDKSTLRRSFGKNEISGEGLSLTGEFAVNTTERDKRKGGKRFNYAYYIHEKDAGGKKLRHPGTVKKFLDVPAEQNEDKWLRGIEQEIEDELKRKGW